MRDGRFSFALGDRGVGVAAPTGAATLRSTRCPTDTTPYGTRRPLGTTLRNLTIAVQLEPLVRDARDWGRPNWRIV